MAYLCDECRHVTFSGQLDEDGDLLCVACRRIKTAKAAADA